MPFTFPSIFFSLSFIYYCPRKKKINFPQEAVLMGKQAETLREVRTEGRRQKPNDKIFQGWEEEERS